MSEPNGKAILLWDGECLFCKKCVEQLIKLDEKGQILPLPYQEVPSPPMCEALKVRCQRAIQLIAPGQNPTSAGRAFLGILSLLGWKKSAAIMSAAPFVYAVEFLYWLIARNRRLMSRLQDIDKVDPGIITPDTTPASKETASLKEGNRQKNRSQ
jgi:predicted DCC family thiol-disulfide oxidoreductase YuxK